MRIKTIVVAIAAKNIHKTLAPWCLKAYVDAHLEQPDIQVLEYSINDSVTDILCGIVRAKPDILGFSCYIWNIDCVQRVLSCVKKLLPKCVIILGGPEVSYEKDVSNYIGADYIISGPGEVAFCKLITSLQHAQKPSIRVISSKNAESFASFPSPFTKEFFESFSKDKMLSPANQLIYYESTRGCPFRCAYCLSSTSEGVDSLTLDRVYVDIERLLCHGAACIKFVDRTFNADTHRAYKILEFIRSQNTTCLFHFEVGADLFDKKTMALIQTMPVHRVQFEMGIQSTNLSVLSCVNRKTDIAAALEAIRRLSVFGNCHIHADLIAGLPYETKESFASAVDACVLAAPHTLQVGFLKLLKGSLLRQDSDAIGLVYQRFPPYQILQTPHMEYEVLCGIHRVEEVIDKFYNSGLYTQCLSFAISSVFGSAYRFFEALGEYCFENGGIRVSLKRSYTLLLEFLSMYTQEDHARHLVKLDCLSHDPKGMLPDSIPQIRDKQAEKRLRCSGDFCHKPLRVEFFEYDGTKRLFVYDKKHPVTGGFTVSVLKDTKLF